MKRLIADIYKIVYQLTHAKSFSFIFALAYITALNLISIYGLALLLAAWLPTKSILRIFAFPYFVIPAGILLYLNYRMMLPLKSLHKERKKTPFYPSIIAYSVISIVLCLYIHYKDRIF